MGADFYIVPNYIKTIEFLHYYWGFCIANWSWRHFCPHTFRFLIYPKIGKRIAHVTLWAFIVLFSVAIAFIAGYMQLEEDRAYHKECPVDIKNEKTGEVIKKGVDPYDCIPGHLKFLEVVRTMIIVFIPLYAVYMLASFHKILRMI